MEFYNAASQGHRRRTMCGAGAIRKLRYTGAETAALRLLPEEAVLFTDTLALFKSGRGCF